MYHCQACGVTVQTMGRACPLCRGTLSGDETGTEQTYIAVDVKKSRRLLWESSVSLTLVFAQILVNLLTTPRFLWSIPCCATVLYSWLIVVLARTGRMRYGFTWYHHLLPVTLVLILYNLFIIEAGSALSWFPTYGLAFCIATFLLINNGWILISRRSVFNILPSQLFICVLGLVPICLALFSVIALTWASIGTASLSLATVTGLLIVYRTRIFQSLRRYFYTM